MIHKNLFCYSERSEGCRFKIQWPQGRGGSIPPSGTHNGCYSNEFQPFFRAGKRLSEKLLDRAFLFDR